MIFVAQHHDDRRRFIGLLNPIHQPQPYLNGVLAAEFPEIKQYGIPPAFQPSRSCKAKLLARARLEPLTQGSSNHLRERRIRSAEPKAYRFFSHLRRYGRRLAEIFQLAAERTRQSSLPVC